MEFRRPNGGFIYDTDPNYCEADAQVKLLLRSVNGAWEVVSGGGDGGAYCVSDFAGYGHYVDDFGAPRSIFPESPYCARSLPSGTTNLAPFVGPPAAGFASRPGPSPHPRSL